MIICVLQLSINRGPLTGSINIQMKWRAVVVQRSDFKHSCLCSIKMEYDCSPGLSMKYKGLFSEGRGEKNPSLQNVNCLMSVSLILETEPHV